MRKLLLGLFVASTLLFITGCNEATPIEDGRATLYVYSEDGRAIQNALVVFRSPVDVPNGLEVYKYTEIDGSAFVKWSYDVFADVEVSKAGLRSCTAIQIEPGKTTEKDLILLPTDHPANGCP
ncbi:hypothetical protein [Phaeocystidibacter luteus]|uniref:Uncharacterized protein n=1 Tax=Phaeocystidibacter luteus TaxID=911197 RepID=A0A6N6RHA7_9FLAO|nr:hypothetical protein [Phaeocystidibacter luteus]KAB2810132.1 hypothetical protein F8C67_07805 [Phaeocystidibacter luteus]